MPTKNAAAAEAKLPLLTIQDVATLDNCSVKTVRRAIDAGRLEALRLGPDGRLIRITREAHQRYRYAGRQ